MLRPLSNTTGNSNYEDIQSSDNFVHQEFEFEKKEHLKNYTNAFITTTITPISSYSIYHQQKPYIPSLTLTILQNEQI